MKSVKSVRPGGFPHCHPEFISGSHRFYKGFTLIEILIAMTIVSILVFSLSTIINSSIKQNTKNEKDIKLLNIAQSEIENLRRKIKLSSNDISIEATKQDGSILIINIPNDEEIIWNEFDSNKKIDKININTNGIYKDFIGTDDDGSQNTSIIQYERDIDGDIYIIKLELLRQQKASKYLYDIKVKAKLKDNYFSKKEIILDSKILSK